MQNIINSHPRTHTETLNSYYWQTVNSFPPGTQRMPRRWKCTQDASAVVSSPPPQAWGQSGFGHSTQWDQSSVNKSSVLCQRWFFSSKWWVIATGAEVWNLCGLWLWDLTLLLQIALQANGHIVLQSGEHLGALWYRMSWGGAQVDLKGYMIGSPWESREVMWESSYGHSCKGVCTIPCFLRAS